MGVLKNDAAFGRRQHVANNLVVVLGAKPGTPDAAGPKRSSKGAGGAAADTEHFFFRSDRMSGS